MSHHSESHVALDLIQLGSGVELLTRLLYDTCQPDWTTLTTHEQTSLVLGDPPSTLPKKLHHVCDWSQTSRPLSFIMSFNLKNLYLTWRKTYCYNTLILSPNPSLLYHTHHHIFTSTPVINATIPLCNVCCFVLVPWRASPHQPKKKSVQFKMIWLFFTLLTRPPLMKDLRWFIRHLSSVVRQLRNLVIRRSPLRFRPKKRPLRFTWIWANRPSS